MTATTSTRPPENASRPSPIGLASMPLWASAAAAGVLVGLARQLLGALDIVDFSRGTDVTLRVIALGLTALGLAALANRRHGWRFTGWLDVLAVGVAAGGFAWLYPSFTEDVDVWVKDDQIEALALASATALVFGGLLLLVLGWGSQGSAYRLFGLHGVVILASEALCSETGACGLILQLAAFAALLGALLHSMASLLPLRAARGGHPALAWLDLLAVALGVFALVASGTRDDVDDTAVGVVLLIAAAAWALPRLAGWLKGRGQIVPEEDEERLMADLLKPLPDTTEVAHPIEYPTEPPEVPPAAAEPVIEEPEPVAAEPVIEEPEPVAAEPVIEEPEPVAAEPVIEEPEPVAAEPVIEEPEPAPVEPEPEPEPVAAERVAAEPVIEEPEAVIEEPEPVAAEPVIEEPEPVAAEPVIEEPEPVAAEPEPVPAGVGAAPAGSDIGISTLADLPDRDVFDGRLLAALNQAPGPGERPLVALVSASGITHATDEATLDAIARRLQRIVGPGDIVARAASDEFALLLDSVSDTDAQDFASRLEAVLAEPHEVDGQPAQIKTATGITAPEVGDDGPDATLVRARVALYEARGQGDNKAAVWLG